MLFVGRICRVSGKTRAKVLHATVCNEEQKIQFKKAQQTNKN